MDLTYRLVNKITCFYERTVPKRSHFQLNIQFLQFFITIISIISIINLGTQVQFLLIIVMPKFNISRHFIDYLYICSITRYKRLIIVVQLLRIQVDTCILNTGIHWVPFMIELVFYIQFVKECSFFVVLERLLLLYFFISYLLEWLACTVLNCLFFLWLFWFLFIT